MADPQVFITSRTNRCAHCDELIKPGALAYHDDLLGPFCSVACAGEWDIDLGEVAALFHEDDGDEQ